MRVISAKSIDSRGTAGPSLSTTHKAVNASRIACGSDINFDYAIALSVICGVCSFFGICYLLVGYRYLKATFFLTGFIFGSLLLYLICIHQQFLPPAGNVGVAVSAGVVCGLVCMLLLLVGYFLTGFFTGFVFAVVILVIIHQINLPEHRWLTFGLLAGCSLLIALCNLKFQKALTILGTCVFGAALVIVGIDYFAEMFLLVLYLWSRIRSEPSKQQEAMPTKQPYVKGFELSNLMRLYNGIPCWHTAVMMGAFPILIIIGVLIQACVTAKGLVHKERFGLRRRRRGRRSRPPGDSAFAEELQEDRRLVVESRATAGENGKIYTSVVPSTSGSGAYGGGPYDTGTMSSRGGTVQLRRGPRTEGSRGSAIVSTPDPSMKYCYLYHMRQIGGDVPSQSAMKDFRQTRQSALIGHYSDSSETDG